MENLDHFLLWILSKNVNLGLTEASREKQELEIRTFSTTSMKFLNSSCAFFRNCFSIPKLPAAFICFQRNGTLILNCFFFYFFTFCSSRWKRCNFSDDSKEKKYYVIKNQRLSFAFLEKFEVAAKIEMFDLKMPVFILLELWKRFALLKSQNFPSLAFCFSFFVIFIKKRFECQFFTSHFCKINLF